MVAGRLRRDDAAGRAAARRDPGGGRRGVARRRELPRRHGPVPAPLGTALRGPRRRGGPARVPVPRLGVRGRNGRLRPRPAAGGARGLRRGAVAADGAADRGASGHDLVLDVGASWGRRLPRRRRAAPALAGGRRLRAAGRAVHRRLRAPAAHGRLNARRKRLRPVAPALRASQDHLAPDRRGAPLTQASGAGRLRRGLFSR
mmetsp:Transcript_30578/g.103106  ORF Transcript_30578/g.103106 Transcript_30578/m.103106 type:complete len:202 (-) Transcript_30578:565-1170(-)